MQTRDKLFSVLLLCRQETNPVLSCFYVLSCCYADKRQTLFCLVVLFVLLCRQETDLVLSCCSVLSCYADKRQTLFSLVVMQKRDRPCFVMLLCRQETDLVLSCCYAGKRQTLFCFAVMQTRNRIYILEWLLCRQEAELLSLNCTTTWWYSLSHVMLAKELPERPLVLKADLRMDNSPKVLQDRLLRVIGLGEAIDGGRERERYMKCGNWVSEEDLQKNVRCEPRMEITSTIWKSRAIT